MKFRIAAIVIVSVIFSMGQGCSKGMKSWDSQSQLDAASASSTAPVPAAAGGGATVAGVGAASVPTGPGLVMRIQNGLQKNVSSSAGNFAKALTALSGNLPKVTDPTKAIGFDQAQLLVYAACSDLVTGAANSKMNTVYKVNPASTIAVNQANLISAGVTMLDQYVAGMASQSAASANVTAALTSLVQEVSATAGNTSTIAFMSVCIAANTAGSSLMGF